MSYRIPLNVEEQTHFLVEAGVAAMVLQLLPHMVKGATNVDLEQCRFWAERTYEHENGFPLLGGGLQVVIQYPRCNDDSPYPYSGHGILVTMNEKPLSFGEGKYLSPEQIALVDEFAGPPESWLPGPLWA